MTPTEFHASVRPLLHFDRNGLWGDVINPREDQVPLLVNPVQYGVDLVGRRPSGRASGGIARVEPRTLKLAEEPFLLTNGTVEHG